MEQAHSQFIDEVTRDSIFSSRSPLLIDVRSEGEFLEGEIPGSINLPILNNEERHDVGLVFKNEGRTAALALGHSLVSGQTRERREILWSKAIESGAKYLSCWRGGLRSKISQDWLRSRGLEIERIEGGTKALRQVCLNTLETDLGPNLVLRGRTGSGKTKFLLELAKQNHNLGFLDLEGCANHRGSAFGKRMSESQPLQASFENRIAFELMYLRRTKNILIVEGESKSIGKNILPMTFFEKMREASFIYLTTSLEERVANIYVEYIVQALASGLSSESIERAYIESLRGIEKKLGGIRLKEVLGVIEKAFAQGDSSLHRDWIEKLLVYYYDPLYDFGHQRMKSKMEFEGNAPEVTEFLIDGMKKNAYA